MHEAECHNKQIPQILDRIHNFPICHTYSSIADISAVVKSIFTNNTHISFVTKIGITYHNDVICFFVKFDVDRKVAKKHVCVARYTSIC